MAVHRYVVHELIPMAAWDTHSSECVRLHAPVVLATQFDALLGQVEHLKRRLEEVTRERDQARASDLNHQLATQPRRVG